VKAVPLGVRSLLTIHGHLLKVLQPEGILAPNVRSASTIVPSPRALYKDDCSQVTIDVLSFCPRDHVFIFALPEPCGFSSVKPQLPCCSKFNVRATYHPLGNIILRKYSISLPQDDHSHLSAPSPNPSNNGSNETFIDPSPIAPSSNGTDFADLDEVVERRNINADGTSPAIRSPPAAVQQPELRVGEENNMHLWALADMFPNRSQPRHLQDLCHHDQDLTKTKLLNPSSMLHRASQNLYDWSLAVTSISSPVSLLTHLYRQRISRRKRCNRVPHLQIDQIPLSPHHLMLRTMRKQE
jgi:hypothetical protein